jgi:tRNA A-37 threonylcarbamoyl transferase component Bud32
MDPRIGTEFAGHRIESVIGRGGASVVYLAEHLRLGRRVALKVLAPHLADDESFRERFIRESRIAAGLDHPNIVTVYDAGEVEGSLYISMRLVEGSDLGKILAAEGALEPARAISILAQIASALDAAHAQGLVHRDVKPANILVTTSTDLPDYDRAYLSDFGISKRTTSREGLTRTGQFVGTVDYVAPEQITGEPVDGRTDVYSLGCVLFECLTGRVPFPGETGVATIYSHLHDRPPSLEGFGDRGKRLDRVMARALSKSKDARYHACGDVVEAARAELTAAPSADGVVGAPSAGERRAGAHRLVPGGGRGRAAGIAAAAVVAVTVVAFALALPDDDGNEGGAETGATGVTTPVTGATGDTDTGGQIGNPPSFIWTPSYETESSGLVGAAITDAVLAGDAVLAVGHAPPGSQPLGTGDNAAVWRTEDGRQWFRVGRASLAEAGDQRMIAVTTLGELVIAVGRSDSDSAVWVSDDVGETWSRSDDPDLAAAGLQQMRDVATVGSELVAVGTTGLPQQQDAAVWTSTDGRSWDAVSSAAFDIEGDQELFALRAADDLVIAAGISYEVPGDIDAAVWTLASGTWSRVPAETLAGPVDEVMLDVAEVGAGGPFVAVGCEAVGVRCDTDVEESDAAVWTSADGFEWARVPAEGRLGGEGVQVMRAVITYRDALIAVGTAGGPLGDEDGGVWTSLDGVQWRAPRQSSPNVTALGGRGDQTLRAVIEYRRHGITLFGFGVVQQDDTLNARVWSAIVE